MKQALFSLTAAAAATLVALGATSAALAGQGGTGTIVGHVHHHRPVTVQIDRNVRSHTGLPLRGLL